ncbi:MAG: MFS transporter [Thermoprotei archaeon]|nr:MAG: MFS transporter [Thermoprotei archaeon]
MRRDLLALIGNSICVWFPGAVTFGLIGLLTPTWAEMFGVGRGPLGLVMTFLLASLGLFMFLGGRWSDRYGARLIATIGSIIAAVSLALFTFSESLDMLYLLAFSWGAGICLVYVPTVSSAQRWFPQRRGMASGIVSMLFGISAAFMIPVFRYWMDNLGYSATLLITAILTAVVGVLSAQLIEFPERLSPVLLVISKRLEESKAERKQEILYTLREALKTKAFWLTWLTWALCGGAGIGMVVFSTSISLELGLTTAMAATALAAFNLTNGLGRMMSGILSDKIGRVTVMSSLYIAGAGGFFLLLAGKGLPHIVLLSNLLAGLAFGTLFAVSAPFIMDCFGTKHYGAIFGFTFTAYGFVGSWIGPFIGGLLRDLTGSYQVTCLVFGLYCVASAASIFLAKPPHSKP